MSLSLLAVLTVLAIGLGLVAGTAGQRRVVRLRKRRTTVRSRAQTVARGAATSATQKGLRWWWKRRSGRDDEGA